MVFLTDPKLDRGQAISVQRIVNMDSQVIVIAGSNDHLQSRGLPTRLRDGSDPSNEVMGESMTELETSVRQRFTKNVVKFVFVLSPGYAALP